MQFASAIHKHLQKARKIMIVPHQNPDEDAMGSATAFYEYVTKLGKPAVIFCVTPLSGKLNFVPPHTFVMSDPALFKHPQIDTIIILDSGDLRYAGVEQLLRGHPATIINIDHHATNQKFGHFNLVLPTAASTTEILFHYFRHVGFTIDKNVATSLLAGLATDTMNFTNGATTSSALAASGELILCGGNFNLVTTKTLKNQSVESLKLWGKALSRLQNDEHLNLTYTFITQADLKELGIGESESQGISNFLNNLENTNITLILTETADKKVKGSFRTTRDGVDVSALAKKFNGGGHKKAAGFTADGTIDEVLKKILAAS